MRNYLASTLLAATLIPLTLAAIQSPLLSANQVDRRGQYVRPIYSVNPVGAKRNLGEFTRLAHGLKSGNVSILNEQTFHIPNLYYDGQGPDAFFFVGTGPVPVNGQTLTTGTKIPNEYGSYGVLKKYSGQSIKLKIPNAMKISNYDWLAVWCVKYTHLFGYVLIPKAKN